MLEPRSWNPPWGRKTSSRGDEAAETVSVSSPGTADGLSRRQSIPKCSKGLLL